MRDSKTQKQKSPCHKGAEIILLERPSKAAVVPIECVSAMAIKNPAHNGAGVELGCLQSGPLL